MAIVIINPNSTASMTDAMVRQAHLSAPEMDFEGWTSHDAPASIQGPEDGDAATAPLLKLVSQAANKGANGIIIGCFDDTALEAAAQIATCPVIGIGQASYAYAALRNWRFSVVTTLSVSVPVIEKNIQRQGLARFMSKTRASEVPVLELEANPCRAGDIIAEEAQNAASQDNISAVILGCAGMVEVFEQVRKTVPIKVIDPVSCAAQSMAWLCR